MTIAVDPDALIASLTAAGFATAGRSRGYTSFRWPGGMLVNSLLMVPTDPTAPEFGQIMTAVLLDLEEAAMRGDAARRVLEGLGV